MVQLASNTSPQWADLCVRHMDAVLADHAHCEKKAAVSALSLINSYPQHTYLVRQAGALAQEELRHFRQVHRFLVARGLTLNRDAGDPYVNHLRKAMRHARQDHFMDRLLISALVEARSCERLNLLGHALQAQATEQPERTLAAFYLDLATREAGHATLFTRLAERYCDSAAVHSRLDELLTLEAAIVADLPLEPRIH